MSKDSSELVVWRFIDGKPGHEKQSQALLEIIASRYRIDTVDIPVGNLGSLLVPLATGRWQQLNNLPRPDIALGVGHATHKAILTAKRCFAAKTVVIMSPSLPISWFDAVISPAHDGKPEQHNRLVTATALAPAIDSHPDAKRGLILLGGVSKHFQWHNQSVYQHLHTLISNNDQCHWQIGNSRRTPEEFTKLGLKLQDEFDRVTFSDHQSLPKQWLNDQLACAGQIWVTVDSASMLAESLATAASVGCILLPPSGRPQSNKLLLSAQNLINQNTIGVIDANHYQPAPRRSPSGDEHQLLLNKLCQLLGLAPVANTTA